MTASLASLKILLNSANNGGILSVDHDSSGQGIPKFNNLQFKLNPWPNSSRETWFPKFLRIMIDKLC